MNGFKSFLVFALIQIPVIAEGAQLPKPFCQHLLVQKTESLARLHHRLDQLNQAFQAALRFTKEERHTLAEHLSTGPVEDLHQFNQLFVNPDDELYYFVSIQPGQLHDWELPIHDFLKSVLTPAINVNPSTIPDAPLNPIQKHRQELLSEALRLKELQLGQPVMFEGQVSSAAREVFSAHAFLTRLSFYDPTKLSPGPSILTTKKELLQVLSTLRTSRFTESVVDRLTALLSSPKGDSFRAEFQYYLKRTQEQNSIKDEFADVVAARLLLLLEGTQSYQEFITAFVKQQLRETLEKAAVGLGGVPFSMLPTLVRSIDAEVQAEGRLTVVKKVGQLDWSRAQVTHLGQWLESVLHTKKPLFVPIESFAIDVPSPEGVRHFALALRVLETEAQPPQSTALERLNYSNVRALQVLEIRETTFGARMQDMFATSPTDLLESFVVLEDGSIAERLPSLPNQILFLKVPDSRAQEFPPSTVETFHLAAEKMFETLDGAPAGPYAQIRLFRDFQQIYPSDLYLPLVERGGGRERFATTIRNGRFGTLQVRLERNLVSSRTTVGITASYGAFGFNIPVVNWRGTFKPPAR